MPYKKHWISIRQKTINYLFSISANTAKTKLERVFPNHHIEKSPIVGIAKAVTAPSNRNQDLTVEKVAQRLKPNTVRNQLAADGITP